MTVGIGKNKEVDEDNVRSENNCRFNYPQQLNTVRSCMKIREYVSGSDGNAPEFTYELCMNSKRNDKWLNSHMHGVMQVWLANMDFQLVVDVNKVVNYMTKYVCKPEVEMSKGLSKMVENLINIGHQTGLGTKGVLKKMMLNLIGSRTISKQESCHLAIGTSMVSCSHVFIRINLTTSLKKLSLRKIKNYAEDDDLEKPTILDMYMIRTSVEIWDTRYEMDTFQNHQKFIYYEFV